MRTGRWNPLRSRFAAMLLFFFAASVAFLYVWERVSAVELTIRIEKLKEEVLGAANEVKKLEIRKSELSSHRRIERIAREELGLKHPSSREIVVVMPDLECVRLAEKDDVKGKN